MKRQPNQVPKSLQNVNYKGVLRKQGIYLKQRMLDDLKEALLPTARKMVAQKEKAPEAPEPQKYAHFTNEEAIAYWEKQIHIVDILEKRFDLKVQQFITKMVNGFLAHLEHEIATEKDMKSFTVKGYFDDYEDVLQTSAQLDFTPLLIDQAVLAGQEAYKLVGSSDIYTPFKLRETIAENVTKFTQSMIDTDRETLINIISNGLKDGKSIPEIRGAIQADFENITKSQAQRVTRTEVLRASMQATIDAYEQSGVVEGKQWLTAGASDECADYEGQIESLDGNFYGDTTEFADGDPPLHPNCRCVLLPVFIGEKGYQIDIKKNVKILRERIVELEAQVDKRTKAYKDIKEKSADDKVYIKNLEKYLGLEDESSREA